MRYELVNIGEAWKGKIKDFAATRNTIMDRYPLGTWIFWIAEDEEMSRMLAKHLETLKPSYPYYAIRRINLENGKYVQWANPDFHAHLVMNACRYVNGMRSPDGRGIHERIVPRKPHGWIDYPIIHDHQGPRPYSSGWRGSHAYRLVHAAKKSLDVLKGR